MFVLLCTNHAFAYDGKVPIFKGNKITCEPIESRVTYFVGMADVFFSEAQIELQKPGISMENYDRNLGYQEQSINIASGLSTIYATFCKD